MRRKVHPAAGGAARPTAVVQGFDPATLQFTPLAGLPVPRSLMTPVALADDRVLAFGGIAARRRG